MSNVYLDDSILTGIANSIRTKKGSSSSITPANMATEIASIPTGGGGTTEPLVMYELKVYTPEAGVDGFSSVTPALDLVLEGGNDLRYIMNSIIECPSLMDAINTLTIKLNSLNENTLQYMFTIPNNNEIFPQTTEDY